MKWLLDPPGFKRMSGRTRKTIELLDIAPGMNVLDAGCGPGRLSIPIAKIIGPDNGIVTAMDIQEGMLDDVRMRAKKENISNINYIHGGIGEKQLPFNHYDRAVMITVIGEIPGREMAMKDIFNAMKPGGILLVEETIRDPHFQTRSAVLKLTGDHGFIEKGFFGNRFSYTLLLEKPIDI
jgi:ubiquinone/menaquinone biosynthesis C-methylase UbiE